MVPESFKLLFMGSSHHLRLKNKSDESLRLIGIFSLVGNGKKVIRENSHKSLESIERKKFFTDN